MVSHMQDHPQRRDIKRTEPRYTPLPTEHNIDNITPADLAGLPQQKRDEIMAQLRSNTPKKKTQSKTYWGVLALVLTGLASVFGIAIEFEWLADGLQWTDAAKIGAAVGVIVSTAATQWGLRTATQPIEGHE